MSLFGLTVIAGLVATLLQGRGVYAQGTNATCVSGFEWMMNSRGQSPCLMTAYLNSACLPDPQDAYVYALPTDFHYVPPTKAIATPCQCSTVFYSMISACGVCQQRENLPWSTWETNCSTVYKDVYPEAIPAGTSIPAWAYLDVIAGDAFNVTAAQNVAAEHLPESTALPVASSTSSPIATFSSSAGAAPIPSSSPASGTGSGSTSSSSHKSSDVGAIVGGVVGGIGGAAIIAGLIAWLVIRNRKRSTTPYMAQPTPTNGQGVYQEKPGFEHTSIAPPLTMSPPPPSAPVYNPEDPFTYPSAQHSYMGPSSPSSASPYGIPQPTPQPYQGAGRYTGVPEV